MSSRDVPASVAIHNINEFVTGLLKDLENGKKVSDNERSKLEETWNHHLSYIEDGIKESNKSRDFGYFLGGVIVVLTVVVGTFLVGYLLYLFVRWTL